MSGARFIGSKISLVSKSDIRYIGILHDVDPQNATLALEQVVSLGTEGRRGGNPMDEIPPSETVFKYIVFRGSDVADLQVFEGPPPTQPPAYMDNDPNTGYYPPSVMHPPPPPQQQPPQFSYPPYGFEPYRPPPVMGFPGYYPTPAPPPPQQAPPTASPLMQMPEPTPQPEFPPPSLMAPEVPHELPNPEQPSPPAPKPDLKDSPAPPKKKEVKVVSEGIASSVEKLAKSVSELGIGKDRSAIASSTATIATTTTTVTNNNGQTRANEKRPSRNGQRRPSTKRQSRNGSNVVPMQDFDFASSNAKFDKEQVLRSLFIEEDTKADEDEVVIPEADTYYDKSKSFFDDISCDVKERVSLKKSGGENYRKKHLQEQKLNLETFGEMSVETTGRNMRGGRGRGGKGRGRGSARNRASKPLQGAA
ncbi:Scd6-like Sm domain-containing protein [Fennellomyces sp. T-0311]|nr:Scd6-like Sm domain-containing protein [Fennellomyces sp. T-0311]